MKQLIDAIVPEGIHANRTRVTMAATVLENAIMSLGDRECNHDYTIMMADDIMIHDDHNWLSVHSCSGRSYSISVPHHVPITSILHLTSLSYLSLAPIF